MFAIFRTFSIDKGKLQEHI
jgi:hypothetical protein